MLEEVGTAAGISRSESPVDSTLSKMEMTVQQLATMLQPILVDTLNSAKEPVKDARPEASTPLLRRLEDLASQLRILRDAIRL